MLARGWIVRSVIAVTLLLTMAMVSLIYIRWLTVQEPTATIVVSGDSSQDGAEILVSGGPSGPVQATLDEANEYRTPIHLQPGDYHVTAKLGDQTILDIEIAANRLGIPDIPLPTQLTVSGDAADDDDADVSLTSADGAITRQGLDRQSDFTAKWWLGPGTYHLTAVRNGITLYDNPALVIALHRPVSIDLTQPRRGRD
jgi:hypothetical protein